MSGRRQCEFFLLRYVPDAVKDEFVNLGVVVYESTAEGGFADVRFTRDWKRVRCLDPDADVEMFEALEADIRQQLSQGASRELLLKKMEDSFSNAIQVTQPKAILAESPQAEIGKLAEIYLERNRRGTRVASGRQVIVTQMRDAFVREGVWPLMRKAIPIAEYTHRGDPLKLDCGYRPNGTVKLFHAVSLETDVNLAKVLAFSYPRIRAGIAEKEKAEAQLTAIVEADLPRDDEGIAFALATLRGHDINVATLAELPGIAERARVEMRI
jgi:Protein of unknown function (DUF3037)